MKWVQVAAWMLTVIAGLCIAAAPACAAEEEARVLILNALDPYLPAYLAIDAAMRASLAKENDRRIVLYSEVLDEQRFPGESLEPEIVALLTKKYRTVHIDVLQGRIAPLTRKQAASESYLLGAHENRSVDTVRCCTRSRVGKQGCRSVATNVVRPSFVVWNLAVIQ